MTAERREQPLGAGVVGGTLVEIYKGKSSPRWERNLHVYRSQRKPVDRVPRGKE